MNAEKCCENPGHNINLWCDVSHPLSEVADLTELNLIFLSLEAEVDIKHASVHKVNNKYYEAQ